MSSRLSGKVAVVTGGASGIGQGSVFRFLQEGARVVIADMDAGAAAQTIDLAAQQGLRELRFIRTDVSREEDVAAAVALAVSEFGGLDCMFNNAGLGGATGAITDMRVEDWDFTMGVLLRGVFLGIKHSARVMKQQGRGGSIISTSSIAGMIGTGTPAAYAAAKAAVNHLSLVAANELGPFRIRVNAIAPGAILTPAVERWDPGHMEGRMMQHQPYPKVGRPSDIGNAAVFLASDESEFVSGITLPVDGAQMALGVGDRVHAIFGVTPDAERRRKAPGRDIGGA